MFIIRCAKDFCNAYPVQSTPDMLLLDSQISNLDYWKCGPFSEDGKRTYPCPSKDGPVVAGSLLGKYFYASIKRYLSPLWPRRLVVQDVRFSS